MNQKSIIGTNVKRIDALEKVTGTAVFSDDITMNRMVHGKILHSPYAHARIDKIDVSASYQVSGVVDVILAKDLFLNRDQGSSGDWLLAEDEVCYVGDRIALVIAESEDAAQDGVNAIQIQYTELPVAMDPSENAKPGSPLVCTRRGKNTHTVLNFQHGNVDALFNEADIVVSEHFVFNTVHQAHLEPNSATATYINGKLTVYCASQVWFRLRHDLSKITGIPESHITVHPQTIGGAFGARNEQAAPLLAAIMAIRTGRPAKITNTREEEFYSSHPAVEFQIDMSICADREGHLLAKRCHYYTDVGAYDVAGESVTWVASTRTDALYQFQATHTVAEAMYTNRAPTAAYRGYGNPQAHFAQEALIDMIAEKLGMSPIDIRSINFTKPNMTALNGYRIKSNGLQECLKKAVELSGWNEKYGKLPRGKGIGISGLVHASGSRAGEKEFSGGSATLKAELSGRVTVYVGEAEIGQGCKTVMAQIVAEELGILPENVTVVMGDTDETPFSTGTHGSKLTTVLGNAVLDASKKMSEQICMEAQSFYGTGQLILANGYLCHHDGKILRSFEETLYDLCVKNSGKPFITMGTFEPDAELMDDNGYGSVAANYPFGVQIVELTVEEDGIVRIDHVTSIHDVGKVINPQMALGQIYGGVTQAVGFSLMEQNGLNDQGIMTAGSFLEYKMPTTLDVPEIIGGFVEPVDPYGPYGAKALGEPPIIGIAAAAANAYYNATGRRITEIPLTPSRVLKDRREAEYHQKEKNHADR